MRPNGAFQGSQASDGADGKSRGSKQKIIQLKDELNGGSLQINPKFEKLKVLRESYDIAKFRANELLLPHDQNLYLKAHGLRASKIYSALSTLIFVSISCSKVEELEDYVMKSAAQVPSTIFDLEEWSSIVKIAKDCREGDSNSLREQVSALKKNMSVYNQLAANPLKAAQMELKLLRSEVMNELGGAQTDLAGSINLMMQLARELSGGSGTDVGESARRLSKLLHATDHHDKQAETAKNEELEALRVYQKDASEQLHKLHAESADLKAQLGAATSRADSAEAQNKQLVTNVSDLAHEIDAVKAAVAASPRHISSEQQAQQARDFQELYEQYSHLSATLQQRDQHILDLQDQIKGGSLKKRMDEEEQEPVPTPTPQIQIDLENQVSVLTQYVTELEHEMLKEKEKIKSLSTEVRLTEAARCEAAGYAETASQDLMYAKEDIFSLQAEIAGLRAALHAHSEYSADRGVSVPKGVSPRALSSPMGSFSALRIDTRRASFDTIVEVKEEDEGVNVMSNDDMSLVTEAPLDTPSISPMGGASMRSVRTELPGEPVKEEEPAERATPSDEDGRIITAEAEHTATSAIFIGKMQVALLQEEFAHHPPQAPAPEESQVPVEEEAAEDPTRELVGETEGIVVSAIEPTTDSIVEHEHVAEHIAEPVVEPVVELEEAKAPEQIEADLHSEVSLEVGTLLPPDGSGDDLNSSDNDARLIADEAARLAHSAVFLGAVHVAVMQDEFVSHSRPQSVPPPEEGMPPQTAEVTLTEDTAVLVPTALEVSDPIVETPADASVVTEVEKQEEIPSSEAPSAATTEEPSESNVQAGDAQLIAAEASRVAASAVFLGAVHVAVLQDEFAHHGQTAPQADPSVPETLKDVLETPIEARAEAKPESEVEITIITPEQLLPVESAAPLGANDGDAAIIAAEAAHTAASALFLGAVHVAVMQEEFHQHPHSASNDGRDSAVVEEAPVVVEKAASAEASLEPVVVENVSENVLEPQSVPVESLTANADQDIIADEAAKLVNATVFLGAVHVAVMKDEFSHHAPAVELPVTESEPERIAEDPVAPANEAPAPSLSPGAKQESAPVLSEPETQKTESDHTVEAQPEAPSTEPAETLPFPVADESAPVADDAQIISDEAARTVASSVFLGAMHVAVMQDEFTHLPQHSSPTDVVEIKSTEDSAPPTEDVDIGSSAEVAVAAVEDPPVETPLEQLVPTSSDPSAEDSQIIAAEAAHTAASALFLGTVHVAVMQDEFSNSHVAAPVTDAGESAAVDVSLETEATETRPAKEMDPESARLTSPASVARVESASKVDIATHDMPAPVEEDKAAVVPEESGKIEPVLTQELSVAEDPAAVNETAAEAAPVEEAEPIGEVQAVDMTSGPEAPPVKVETTDKEIPPPPAESPSESVTTITGPSEADIPHAELSPVETVVDSAPADGEVHAEGGTPKEESTVSVPDPRSEGNEASVKMDVVVATTSSKKEAPAAPWDIVAAKGTEQGKSGWYTDKGQLFYYCEDKGKPVLLCGPISEEVYQMALAVETSAPSDATTPESTTDITIDRLGVRATRLQAESLREEVLNLEQKHSLAIQDVEHARALTEAELYDCQATVQTLNEEISQCKEIIRHLESHRRRSQLSYAAAEQMKAKIAKLTIEQVVALIKLTSMVRGFIGRARVRRIQTSKQAQEAGLLYAMSNTKQGESGWYMGPKRNIFYFAQKNGMWTNVAGPLTEEDFELMVLARKQKQVSNSQEVLTLCHVKLQPDYEALVDGGELYVANVTDKVYVCRPLDSMIAASGSIAPSPAPMPEQQEVEQKLNQEEQHKQEQKEESKQEVQKQEQLSAKKAEVVSPQPNPVERVPSTVFQSIPEDQAILRQESSDDIQEPASVSVESAPTVRLKSATERQVSFSARSASADLAILHLSAEADDAKTAQEGRWQ